MITFTNNSRTKTYILHSFKNNYYTSNNPPKNPLHKENTGTIIHPQTILTLTRTFSPLFHTFPHSKTNLNNNTQITPRRGEENSKTIGDHTEKGVTP